ncbi:MAG: hypothetical protein F4086_07600, partial [Gemmatimonadetes bacterium]|nr:hypothetical protein [Gemmatimonadota bacterium]MYJ10163.1 hypothetical protein [Gemmatimonadota bacterium]
GHGRGARGGRRGGRRGRRGVRRPCGARPHQRGGHPQGQVVLGFALQQPGLGPVEKGARIRVAHHPQPARHPLAAHATRTASGRPAARLPTRPNLRPSPVP